MRVLLLLSLLAVMVGCGKDVEDMCEYDCRQTRACLVSLGYLPEASEEACVDNCLAAAEDGSVEAHLVDVYDTCHELASCEWVDCVSQ